jgi:hypothetical protein
MTKTTYQLTALVCLGSLGASAAHGLGIEYKGKLQGASLGAGTGEIISFSPLGNTLASTGAGGVQLYALDASYGSSLSSFVDYSGAFAAAGTTLKDVTSVALDRQNRGFGVASLVSTDNATKTGLVGLFNHTTGAHVTTFDVGYHPDSVSFSPDGKRVFVVNEGEFTTAGDANQAPGSVTVIDLSNVTDFTDGAHIQANSTRTTYDFSAANLAHAGLLTGIRQNDATASVANNIEPEFASLDAAGGKLYVSLQENNAIAALDLNSGQWTAVNQLGTITQTLDASDNELAGNLPKLEINDQVAGMPMPDTIATFTAGGKTYVATANEGDARPDDVDQVRVRDLPAGAVDLATEVALNATYGNYKDRKALGRLNISPIDGDTDHDGDIDVLTAFGSRSVSIYEINSATGELVDSDGNAANGLTPTWDSGALESLLSLVEPNGKLHNSEGTEASFDGRSDNKGPEPEALAVANIGGHDLLAAGMERQGGLLLWDVTDPSAPLFLDYASNALDELLRSPESILLLDGDISPTGKTMMIVGYEGADSLTRGIGLYEVPEPETYGLAFGLAGLGYGIYRRRLAGRSQASQ